MKLATGDFEIFVYLAVHMCLPIQRTQRLEIILCVNSRPGKTIAAVDIAGDALAERTVWIVNAHLRNRAEDRMTTQTKAGDDTEYQRRDNPSRKLGRIGRSRRVDRAPASTCAPRSR